MSNILQDNKIIQVPEIIKLDIEGAEIEVIRSMLSSKIKPRQLLVEFDILRKGGLPSVAKFIIAHQLIKKNGYVLINKEGLNYSYLLSY